MLAVAARSEPKIEWRLGDAASLPFEDGSFDVVVSQFALMYFPDREASLRVMQALAAESENALVEFVVPPGEIIMPMDAHIVTPSKG